jgi:hypothetical protein
MLGLQGKKIDAKPEALIAAVAGGKGDVVLDDFEAEEDTETVRTAAPLLTDLVPKVSIELESFE